MKVGPGGGEAEVLAMEADGAPFNFFNGVDVDQGMGDVYFTDSSTVYTHAYNTEIMIHRDAAGRLLRYNARGPGTPPCSRPACRTQRHRPECRPDTHRGGAGVQVLAQGGQGRALRLAR